SSSASQMGGVRDGPGPIRARSASECMDPRMHSLALRARIGLQRPKCEALEEESFLPSRAHQAGQHAVTHHPSAPDGFRRGDSREAARTKPNPPEWQGNGMREM